MKTYKATVVSPYRLAAHEELTLALQKLGFGFISAHISRGCHWGEIWFFNENLEKAKSMMDPKDRHFRIDTETRYFYLSPYDIETGSHWQFSVESNKPKEYKPRTRKKRGPYHK